MTMAARIARLQETAMDVAAVRRLARVVVYDDPAAAEPFWRKLECSAQVSTPFQSFDFIAAWQRTIGKACGVQSLTAVAFDTNSDPVAVLPLVAYRQFGITIAEFAGGNHTTFNMALWRRDLAANITSIEISKLVEMIKAAAPALDVLALLRQPRSWNGIQNPFSLLPRQISADDCPRISIEPDAAPTARISNSMRKRLRGKERKLEALPGYRHLVASDSADVDRLLDVFFRLKPEHMAAQNLPNVFAEPGVEAFVRDICTTHRADGKPLVNIHAIVCNDEVLALFAGVTGGHRLSMMFNTYTLSANSRFSPGLILIRRIVDQCAEDGLKELDFGVGMADYKLLFCKEQEPLFDSFVPLSARGRIAAAALSQAQRIKRFVKRRPALLRFARRIRSRRF